MLNKKVLLVICAVYGAGLASIGADLDDDNFRMLDNNEDSGVDWEELDKVEWDKVTSPNDKDNEDPANLPYENLEMWDKLSANPPFPVDLNDQPEDEIDREKRSNSLPTKSKKQKIDLGSARIGPKKNSKFHGSIFSDGLKKDKE